MSTMMLKSKSHFWISFYLILAVESLDSSVANDDLLGLIAFKAGIEDAKKNLESWNEENRNFCEWHGIVCAPKLNRVSELVLDGSSLSGRISRGILKLEYLTNLSLSKNNFTGSLPENLTQLGALAHLDVSENGLDGPIPDDFFAECGSLRSISIGGNRFSGKIPGSLRNCSSSLVHLNFSSNLFSGPLDPIFRSLRNARILDLSSNEFAGEFPESVGGLLNLRFLSVQNNRLSGNFPSGIGNCKLLKSIDASRNFMSGEIPDTLTQLRSCVYLNLSSNGFAGAIPNRMGETEALQFLDLSANRFHGRLPDSLWNLQNLTALNLSHNSVSGDLPRSLRNCTSLTSLDLRSNSLSGDLPVFTNDLLFLDLSRNNFSGYLTSAVRSPANLKALNLSRNSLSGFIPSSIGNLESLDTLDLSMNRLTGSIPVEIGRLASLERLILSRNHLSGAIPTTLVKLTKLTRVDFSFNNLTGNLPKLLGNLPHLESFTINNNSLEGPLPAGRFFNTISSSSVSGNPLICGSAVNRTCHGTFQKPIFLNPHGLNSSSFSSSSSSSLPSAHRLALSVSALVSIGAASVIVVGIIAITVLNLQVRRSPSSAALPVYSPDVYSSADEHSGKLVMFSGHGEFSVGDHALLNRDSEIGRGGFGCVYRAELRDGNAVAIKKLVTSGLVKSEEDFVNEVRELGTARHRNVVGLEGYYWTPSLQLLIYEFVSGGNLNARLHGGGGLSWNERFGIVLGISRGLAHLHGKGITHYNLKPSNVFIDESSGEAKVGDYGIVRLLPTLDRHVLSCKVQSALGYMAPEFGCRTVRITEKHDVYGFGVLVLEVVSGRRPVEYREEDVVVLRDIVRESLEHGRAEECVDPRLGIVVSSAAMDEVVTVIKIALVCTAQVPSSRPHMDEVIGMLELIRSAQSSDAMIEESPSSI